MSLVDENLNVLKRLTWGQGLVPTADTARAWVCSSSVLHNHQLESWLHLSCFPQGFTNFPRKASESPFSEQQCYWGRRDRKAGLLRTRSRRGSTGHSPPARSRAGHPCPRQPQREGLRGRGSCVRPGNYRLSLAGPLGGPLTPQGT